MSQVCSCSVKVCFCARGKGQVRAGEVEEARKRRKMPAYLALVWWYLWGFGNWGCCWASRSASSSWPGEQGCHCVRKWKQFKVVHITTPSQHSLCPLHSGTHKPSLPPCSIISMTHSCPWGCWSSWWSICVCCMSPLPLVAGPRGYCDIMGSGFRYMG